VKPCWQSLNSHSPIWHMSDSWDGSHRPLGWLGWLGLKTFLFIVRLGLTVISVFVDVCLGNRCRIDSIGDGSLWDGIYRASLLRLDYFLWCSRSKLRVKFSNGRDTYNLYIHYQFCNFIKSSVPFQHPLVAACSSSLLLSRLSGSRFCLTTSNYVTIDGI
jgi:hypothetical protein